MLMLFRVGSARHAAVRMARFSLWCEFMLIARACEAERTAKLCHTPSPAAAAVRAAQIICGSAGGVRRRYYTLPRLCLLRVRAQSHTIHVAMRADRAWRSENGGAVTRRRTLPPPPTSLPVHARSSATSAAATSRDGHIPYHALTYAHVFRTADASMPADIC